MARIVVCGGGVVGLAAAMMLARDDHDVTVLEWDPQPPPAEPADAWDSWERRGVAQFRQPHNLLPGSRAVLDVELPGLVQGLVDAGCPWFDMLSVQPPAISDREPRADDDRFRTPTGRRPVIEAVVAVAAEATPGLTVRRGVEVADLVAGPEVVTGIPHVAGVRTTAGELLTADLVVDATGRMSRSPDWLAALGAPPPVVESQDCGFAYYTRYFRGEKLPVAIGPVVSALGSFSVLTLPGDNDTWSVTVWSASGDAPLKEMRHNEVYTRVLRACPLQAHWLDGEPLGDVLAMGGILDRYRRFVVDDLPVATGFVALSDAWACTNPAAGRGISVGLVHAQALRHVVRDHLDDPRALALTWDAVTEERVTPFYRRQVRADQVRVAEMLALRDGRPAPADDNDVTKLQIAAFRDADIFRGFLEMVSCLALPDEILSRPEVQRGMAAVADDAVTGSLPGPNREQLLALLAG